LWPNQATHADGDYPLLPTPGIPRHPNHGCWQVLNHALINPATKAWGTKATAHQACTQGLLLIVGDGVRHYLAQQAYRYTSYQRSTKLDNPPTSQLAKIRFNAFDQPFSPTKYSINSEQVATWVDLLTRYKTNPIFTRDSPASHKETPRDK